jgi:uncharacterized protein (TIGR02284 family)
MRVHTNADDFDALVALLGDGANFYADAAAVIDDPARRVLFMRVASCKQALARDLLARFSVRGVADNERGGEVDGLFASYEALLAALGRDTRGHCAAVLEGAEERILQLLEHLARDRERPRLAAIVRRHLPGIREAHHGVRDFLYSCAS